MNAAARVMEQSHLFEGEYKRILIHSLVWVASVLLALVMVSAVAVVYLKGEERQVYTRWQQQQQRQHQLQLERSQLLVEYSTWAAPSRVQHIAEARLKMIAPQATHVIWVD
ncbi:MAG: cell division protein FtsL [Legionellales bacterium]|nr:cell division protein FtsL [Legionellales bacterium]